MIRIRLWIMIIFVLPSSSESCSDSISPIGLRVLIVYVLRFLPFPFIHILKLARPTFLLTSIMLRKNAIDINEIGSMNSTWFPKCLSSSDKKKGYKMLLLYHSKRFDMLKIENDSREGKEEEKTCKRWTIWSFFLEHFTHNYQNGSVPLSFSSFWHVCRTVGNR